MIKFSSVLVSVTLCWQLIGIFGQYLDIPPIPCPTYFQYLSNGFTNIGQIIVPNIQMHQNHIEVQFAQRQPLTSNYFGSLSFYDNVQTTMENLLKGQPISLRVDFPTADLLPLLLQLNINGQVICGASAYSAPYTLITMRYTLNFIPRTTQDSQSAQANDYNGAGSELWPVLSKIINSGHVVFLNKAYTQPPQLSIPMVPSTTKASQHNPGKPILPQSTHEVQSYREQSTFEQTISAQNTDILNAICGRESEIHNISPITHGGVVLRPGEFPWLVAIFKKSRNGLEYICPGSLISSRSILTSAICPLFSNVTAEQVIVNLGRQNLSSFSEPYSVTREIQTVLIHPAFNTTSLLDANLALLQLAAPISFNDYIRPICLWDETSDHSFAVGLISFVAGWGSNNVPKTLQVMVISNEECIEDSKSYVRFITPRTLCAKNRDTNLPCLGDSGGGLMIRRNGRWVVRGLVSTGKVIRVNDTVVCNPNDPVIYTDIAKHLTWIVDSMLT